MKTILLIDDESERSCLFGCLNSFGYDVIVVPDAQSALSIIRQGASIDLVITDDRRIGMDGLEFVSSLRRLTQSLPSIMLTSCASIETYLKAKSLGVFEYLQKPVKPKEMDRVVKAALESAHTFEYGEGI
jgi:DNA-binding NtrC family response regulator